MSGSQVKYYVNKEKRTVVCVITGCEWAADDRVWRYCQSNNIKMQHRAFRISDEYTGVAKCSLDDEWDEDFGKRLAFARARNNRDRAINDKVSKAIKLLHNVEERLMQHGYIFIGQYSQDNTDTE